MKRKYLHYSSHPFSPYPFETFWCDSWRTVECLRISGGTIFTRVDNGEMTWEDIPMSHLRIRSRKATESDCTCFLRPGVDISVLTSAHPSENSDEERTEPVWIDAKIRSIERKPHDFACDCSFYVSLYVTQGPALMVGRMLSKEVITLKIDQISILQKLDQKPDEDEHYRWSFSEDCTSLLKLKLFTGRFSSDLTWLLVASVLKQTAFDVRSVHNKIVYEILDNKDDTYQLTSENHSYALNFKLDNGISAPIIVQFSPSIPEEGPSGGTHEAGPLTIYNPMELRRSKRRLVQPDRYLGCDDMMEYDLDVDSLRFVSKTYNKLEHDDDDDLPLALSIQANHAREKHGEIENKVRSYKPSLYENFRACGSEVKSVASKDEAKDPSRHPTRAHKSHLAIVPVSDTVESDFKAYGGVLPNLKIPEDHSGDIGDIVTRYMHLNGCSTFYRKKRYAGKFPELYGQRWARGIQRVRYRRRNSSSFPLRESVFDVRASSKKVSVSATVCRELIKRCMANIDATLNKEQPPIIDQWEEFKSKKSSNQKECNGEPSAEDEEEISELDVLWKEMELALASCYLLDENEETHVDHSKMQMPNGMYCQHDYRLNEEIGIVCRLCGYVIIEIKNVSPNFLPTKKWIPSKEQRTDEDPEQKLYEEGDGDFTVPASSNSPSSEAGEIEDNVWALIPKLRNKLRFHQKKAFEFLWRNIAGSMVPAEMEEARKKRGGCVISHSPGAGKTLLIIAFLVSYLKLFPGSRPLVLAPKTTLYTWYKEIIKWEIPVPVYQIHGGQTYKGEILRQKLKLNPGLPRNQDVMHVLDCLEKMQKWLAHPSILLMGYTSFLTLMREDSNYAHRKYMAQVLRQCPGILILDEGHNPRSTKSRLRKGLMKVNTKLRVLLSGTLFQNNFGEYFNTLCLARPNFVTEVLKELDPKYKSRKEKKSRFSLENRARKYFVDKISRKINSNDAEERLDGLNVLKKLTSGFIDIYEGSNSDQLPGLQCYTLMMKPTTLQQGILLKLQNQRPVYKGFPLELELLITLGAIHPWLIRTTNCSGQYFTAEELESLEQYKFDLKLGSKVRFVMSLVPRCLLRKEKLLLFCHNIAPINLFLDIFERFYGWRKGEEVLVLSGEIELFERGRLIDKFEDPGGPSKVMLASITACAEGISLTAASRVILLDSEWNPSKSKQAIARAFRPGQEKVVYVYQLLATGTLEEEKYTRTTWKEYVSCMIFSEELVEDPSHWQAPQIEDELLREIVEEDRAVLFHKIMKNVKASNVIRGKNNVSYDNKEE